MHILIISFSLPSYSLLITFCPHSLLFFINVLMIFFYFFLLRTGMEKFIKIKHTTLIINVHTTHHLCWDGWEKYFWILIILSLNKINNILVFTLTSNIITNNFLCNWNIEQKEKVYDPYYIIHFKHTLIWLKFNLKWYYLFLDIFIINWIYDKILDLIKK